MRIPSARGQERINCHSAPWRADAKNKACDGGYAIGCSNLGSMYLNGDGVRQDKFKAVELYTKACDGRNAGGCSNLGVMYDNGDGVRQDKSKALQLFGKACDMKNEGGCKNYAILKNQGIK
jgi:TPR repeat protein